MRKGENKKERRKWKGKERRVKRWFKVIDLYILSNYLYNHSMSNLNGIPSLA